MLIRKFLTFVILLFFSCQLFGQEGHIHITNLEIDENIVDPTIRCIAFNAESFAFIGSRKGVSVYDGRNWTTIKETPRNTFSLYFDSTFSKIYCGFRNEFGLITQDEEGSYRYKALKKIKQKTIEFSKICTSYDEVVFYSNETIYVLNKNSDSVLYNVTSKEHGAFQGIIIQNNSVFVNIKDKGICKLKNGKFSKQNFGQSLKNERILFYTYFNKKNILVGTNDNKIYLFNGKKFMQFASHTGIRDFLKENLLWDGADISGKYFAVTTLTGGCAIVDKKFGKIINVINYQTGLPDDEIFTVALDKDKGLWLAHEQGLSRCDFKLPIKNFASYPGLSGNINDVLYANNKLYVATNNGVFYLEKIKSFREREIIVRKTKSSPTSPKTKKTKRKKETTQLFETRKEYSLRSLTHQYKPVLNLNEKCKQLYYSNGILLTATNFGLFEIYDTLALPVMRNLYVNSICHDKDTTALYVASLDGMHLLTYQKDKKDKLNNWVKTKIFPTLPKEINSVVQDSAGRMFLGTDSKVFLSKKEGALSFSDPKLLELPEVIDEPINLKKIDNQVVLIQSIGVLNYNTITGNIFYKDIKAVLDNNLQYVLGRNGAWIKDSIDWKPALSNTFKGNTKALSIFTRLRKINAASSDILWIINGSHELLKLSSSEKKNITPPINIQITGITDNNKNKYPLENPVFLYSNNAINISVSAPYYIRAEEIQYQYYVKGLKHYENWSDWSTNNTIELSSVPPGKYSVLVRSINVFKQISDTKQVSFSVLPPFWKTRAFYISAGIMFALLLALIFYLTHRQLLKKKRLLEQKIFERTIELEAEKDRVNALLKNILPIPTIKELKKNNKVTPRSYDNATVLFTDFKGFTFIAEKLSPEDLVNEIDYCFKAFDNIIDNYKIEKIKTIGDAYMCAGGLPTKYKYNAIEIVKAALDIRDFMEVYKAERKEQKKPFFEIRIGIHTGPVVAGVVGTRKYAYDIWGDTVNTAARMESSSEPGRVNISEDTYKIIKAKFDCEARGKIGAKNKGEIEMYFVKNLKTKTRKKISRS